MTSPENVYNPSAEASSRVIDCSLISSWCSSIAATSCFTINWKKELCFLDSRFNQFQGDHQSRNYVNQSYKKGKLCEILTDLRPVATVRSIERDTETPELPIRKRMQQKGYGDWRDDAALKPALSGTDASSCAICLSICNQVACPIFLLLLLQPCVCLPSARWSAWEWRPNARAISFTPSFSIKHISSNLTKAQFTSTHQEIVITDNDPMWIWSLESSS